MSTSSSNSVEHTLVHADENLTIFEAAELKTTLLQALSESRATLEINLSAVDELDSAGIQLLLFLKQEATRQTKNIIYSHHSPTLLSAIELLNLAGQLGDPLLMPRGDQA